MLRITTVVAGPRRGSERCRRRLRRVRWPVAAPLYDVVESKYPHVIDEARVGEYPASAKAGGGYVWDAVLEYRVWCCPRLGAEDRADGSDYYYVFTTAEEALAFARETAGAEEPLALILQE